MQVFATTTAKEDSWTLAQSAGKAAPLARLTAEPSLLLTKLNVLEKLLVSPKVSSKPLLALLCLQQAMN